MLRIIGKMLFNKYVWLIVVPVLLIWSVLMLRLEQRTYFALNRQLESVKKIWGGNLEQPMPSIRYKSFGSDVSTLTRGELAASDVRVKLEMDYRKKGLVYYTGYNAEFIGKYTVKNPQKEKIYLSFIFPYPMQQGEGILRDVKLLVNGQEEPANTEYQQNLALWTGLLDAEQAIEFTLEYHGRGLNHFIYGFEPGTQINQFTMTIQVIGARNVDYPVSTMTPSNVETTGDGVTLTWALNRSLTEFNLGVILPDKLNVAQQISVMTRRASAFFLLFIASVCLILKLARRPLSFIKIGVLCAAYFLFYPLLAYLSMYMSVWLAFALAFAILGGLMFNYARIVDTRNAALAITLAYVFYSGITSLAALFPAYTGLILTIEAVVLLLAVVMQVLSRYRDADFMELLGWNTLNKPLFPKRKKAEPPTPPDLPDMES